MTALTSAPVAPWRELRGRATVDRQPLTAPASGVPCAYWSLRVIEVVAPGLEFVHEVCADADLLVELAEPAAPDNAPNRGAPRQRKVVVPRAHARVHVPPVLHHPGSPGAVAVARALGLFGELHVEEFLLRLRDEVRLTGALVEPAADVPSRRVHAPVELWQAEVRLVEPPRPVRLLPWALGTGALLLGALGGAAALLRRMEALSSSPRKALPAEVRGAPALGPPRHARADWP